MRNFTLLTLGATALLFTGAAIASPDDASTDDSAASTKVIDGTAAATTGPTTLPAENTPAQTTVIVPAARDAITNEVVPAEVKDENEPESLRDRVRSKMKEDEK